MWSFHKREAVVLELDDPIPCLWSVYVTTAGKLAKILRVPANSSEIYENYSTFFFLEWRMSKWWSSPQTFKCVLGMYIFLNWNKKGWNSNTQMVLKSRFNAVKVTSNSQKTITHNAIVTLEHIIIKICFITW